MNEVKAAENEEEKQTSTESFGWGGFERGGKKNAEQPKEEVKKPASKPGEIKFGKPQMFTRKKGIGLA